jgi:hypothetical protein
VLPQPGQELPGLLSVRTHRRRGLPPFPRQPQTTLGNYRLDSGVVRPAARARSRLPSGETQPTPTATARERQPRMLPTNSTSQPRSTSTFTLREVKPYAGRGAMNRPVCARHSPGQGDSARPRVVACRRAVPFGCDYTNSCAGPTLNGAAPTSRFPGSAALVCPHTSPPMTNAGRCCADACPTRPWICGSGRRGARVALRTNDRAHRGTHARPPDHRRSRRTSGQ